MKHSRAPQFCLILTTMLLAACGNSPTALPNGPFVDDYGIEYSISDSTWSQQPGLTYLISDHLDGEQSLILKQPPTDTTAALWTRVDWLFFDDMDPWEWGYCYSGWDLPSRDAALGTPTADRSIPLTGCGDFPFSRMRPSP